MHRLGTTKHTKTKSRLKDGREYDNRRKSQRPDWVCQVGGCKSQDVNFCRKTYKDGYMCNTKKMLLLMADFVIDKAETWLRENATDYLDKIEDCYGGNEWETQTWSFPEEFFTKFKSEIKNGDTE